MLNKNETHKLYKVMKEPTLMYGSEICILLQEHGIKFLRDVSGFRRGYKKTQTNFHVPSIDRKRNSGKI